MDARKYWDQFYSDNAFKKGKNPCNFLVEQLARLPKGRVLDIGMGEGQNAVYLAEQGFDVEGIDVSQVAVDRAQALAYEKDFSIRCKRVDMDMYMLELMGYETVIMVDYKPSLKRCYDEIARGLKHGGRLLIKAPLLGSTTPEDGVHQGYFRTNELLRHLEGFTILYYCESEEEQGKRTVSCLAEKPDHKDAQKLNIFDMQAKGKKEEASVHLKAAESLFKK